MSYPIIQIQIFTQDVTGDIEGMEEVADDATKANEKLKKSINGI